MTSLPVRRDTQKHLGAFYSPPDLVEPMVAWAIPTRSAVVLDPSCGDGVFLEAAARRLRILGCRPISVAQQLAGIDLNPRAISVTATSVGKALGGRPCRLIKSDFFQVDPNSFDTGPGGGVDAVIGNPPYIRYQGFAGHVRDQALRRASGAGVRLSQLASSWAPFVIHSATFLRQGGRLALILPAELIHTSYAAPVRDYLRREFGSVSIVSFRNQVFPGVQEKVVLLLAEDRGNTDGDVLRLVEAGDGRDLRSLDRLLDRAEVFRPGAAPAKWIPGFAAGPETSLERLVADGTWAPLGRIAKANIGFVSGANDYFVLTVPEAMTRGLPERSLLPCVVRARQVAGAFLTPFDFERLKNSGQQCLLWRPEGHLSQEERGYVRYGERLGLHRRYKCRMRSPWYAVPGVIVPDALLTYMSDSVPRLCLNEAGIAATNNLLTIRFRSVPPALRRAVVVSFYNSGTLYSVERIGRQYGGGVLKLEPSEAERVLVPDLGHVSRHESCLRALELDLHRELRAGRTGQLLDVIASIDRVLLHDGGARRAGDARVLMEAREALCARRRTALHA